MVSVCPTHGADAQARAALGNAGRHESTALTQGPVAYDADDLAGTWYVHALASGPGAPWWEYGQWTIHTDHSFAGVSYEPQEARREMSGQFLLAPNGAATFTGARQDPNVILFPHLHMAANKAALVGIGFWPSGSRNMPRTTQMTVLTRQGQGYQTVDLAGTWYVHALASGPGAPWWQYGSLLTNADGTFSGVLQEYSSIPQQALGQFQIDPNGVVTTPWLPTKPVLDFSVGHMASDKNMIVIVDTWRDGVPATTGLRILTRKGTDYRISDLAGRWYFHALAAGGDSPWSPWWYGPMDVRSDGSFDAPFAVTQNSYASNWSGRFLIDSDGVVTCAGVTTNPSNPGFITMHLSADKNVMAGVRTWPGGPPTTELMAFTRMGN
jgi:hypothetical protein